MGVPMIGRVRDVRQMITEGDELLLDGDEGVVHVRPTGPIGEAFDAKLLARQKQRADLADFKSLDSIKLDGERLTVAINAGQRAGVEGQVTSAAETHATGPTRPRSTRSGR